RDAERLQIVELLQQAREVPDAVVVAVVERLDGQLVDDRVLVPERVVGERRRQDYAFGVRYSTCFHMASLKMATGLSCGSRRTRCGEPRHRCLAPLSSSSASKASGSEIGRA